MHDQLAIATSCMQASYPATYVASYIEKLLPMHACFWSLHELSCMHAHAD